MGAYSSTLSLVSFYFKRLKLRGTINEALAPQPYSKAVMLNLK